MSLTLMYITNNPEVALIAQKNGVDRIWVDLEQLGKAERQKNMNTVKSTHTINDIKIIAPLMKTSQLLVRVNPWNENSKQEIKDVIEAGADIIMLPMWKSVLEVQNFIMATEGKVKTTLLLETKEAVECLDEVLQLSGIDEIHIGLNDLHLSYGLSFMFELLSNGTVEKICNKIKHSGLPYGFGGIARLGEGLLPAEKIILEHYRLGSTRAILSRSFCNTEVITNVLEVNDLFQKHLNELRVFEDSVSVIQKEELEKNKHEVQNIVNSIVTSKVNAI